MIVGIAGLGLIGGSFARAYRETGHQVLVLEKDQSILSMAVDAEVVHGILTHENAMECDLILDCLYPQAAICFLEEFGPYFGSKPFVLDCCGTKRELTKVGRNLALKYGFTFIGAHPMAGTQYSGFMHSRADMFHGAPMVIVPPDDCESGFLDQLSALLSPAGFGSLTISSAENHDQIIAFTSQLAHVISNAYVKSPSARVHKGFSAGSYKDLSRVAWLNPEMWSELFLDNRENLLSEIDILIGHLEEYRSALYRKDRTELIRLLAEGKKRKEELDEL